MGWAGNEGGTMRNQDDLGPLIDHVGLLVAAATSPVTAALIALVALRLDGTRVLLSVAAVLGVSDAAWTLGALPATVGPAVACAIGAAGGIFQAFLIRPFTRMARALHRALPRNANRTSRGTKSQAAVDSPSVADHAPDCSTGYRAGRKC